MEKYNEEIISILSDKGYDVKHASWGIYSFINGVKVEWKSPQSKLAIGYGNSKEDIVKLRKKIIQEFGKNSIIGNPTCLVHFLPDNPTADTFKILIDLIENLDFKLEKPVGIRGKISLDKTGIFEKMAKQIRFSVENGMPGGLNRGTLQMDSIDDLIIIGESENRTIDNSYREHIIPCDYIISEGVEMVKSNKSNAEIAIMIKNALNIVLITTEEANKLDIELGLKTDMPEDWQIGDNPLARLQIANIKLK